MQRHLVEEEAKQLLITCVDAWRQVQLRSLQLKIINPF